ncbi:MAG: cysteine desulfurase family protein [Chitinophagales bacterium]|nr:cysteine desulfurase family protein [Chitinophagales bacterium]
MNVYLDNAATTPLDNEVLQAMMPYFTEKFGNPSSIHAYGRETKAAIERSRKTIAGYLNASVGEIFFTSGGTETANLIIKCAVAQLGVKHIISSRIEHHCVLHPVEELAKAGNVTLHFVDLDEHGNVDLQHLETLLQRTHKDALVCLMHANNEIGNILPIEKVGELCESYGALFFSDTVQTIAHLPIDLQKIKVHFISGAAHKFHGPKGVGFVYIRNSHALCPLIHGGSQERNMRAGTENIYGIVGLAKAMELAYKNLEEHSAYIQGLKEYFYKKIQAAIPEVLVNGNYSGDSLYTVLNLAFPATEHADYLIYNLDINNIAASAGSACTSGSEQGSHVLKELKHANGKSSVRFSFSKFNTQEELDYVVEKLKDVFVPSKS